jgi:hypothetical protein
VTISALHPDALVRLHGVIGKKGNARQAATAGLYPVSRSNWLAGVKARRYPQPVRCGGIVMWRVRDVLDLIERVSRGELAEVGA